MKRRADARHVDGAAADREGGHRRKRRSLETEVAAAMERLSRHPDPKRGLYRAESHAHQRQTDKAFAWINQKGDQPERGRSPL